MRLVTFKADGAVTFGIWREDGVVNLARRLGSRFGNLAALIAGGALNEARAFSQERADYFTHEVSLLKPLDRWNRCYCVTLDGIQQNSERMREPHSTLYVRFPESFTGPDAPLIRPPESPQLDFEGRVVLLIGKRGRRIPQDRWTEHIAAWTVGSEGTIRDWARHGKADETADRNWPESGAIGPWLVTPDEAGTGPFQVVTRVNGILRHSGSTERMTSSFGRIVEYVSTFCTLEAGDLILTGAATDSDAHALSPIYLRAGDEVVVEIERIGKLANTVADEAPISVSDIDSIHGMSLDRRCQMVSAIGE